MGKKIMSNINNKPLGFTIVELLVVIVVIGILAAITIVSYIGISKKATESTLQSDLATAKKQFALYYTEHGVYPTGLDGNKCPTGTTNPSPDTNYCLKPSSGDDIEISEANGSKYKLTNAKGTLSFSITEDSSASVNDLQWITIGTQTWAKKNLNVGIMIPGIGSQSNNSITEKFCYDDNEANCTANGALYQWSEAVNYHERVSDNTPQQGLCEVGAHIPTADDWIKLVSYLGMTPAEINNSMSSFSGTQGKKLKTYGESNLNIPLAGLRIYSGYDGAMFWSKDSSATLWSATENGDYGYAWTFSIQDGNDGVFLGTGRMDLGYSIRCIKD